MKWFGYVERIPTERNIKNSLLASGRRNKVKWNPPKKDREIQLRKYWIA